MLDEFELIDELSVATDGYMTCDGPGEPLTIAVSGYIIEIIKEDDVLYIKPKKRPKFKQGELTIQEEDEFIFIMLNIFLRNGANRLL